jgi:glycosyltransferase involved in cell wall biosynthesis
MNQTAARDHLPPSASGKLRLAVVGATYATAEPRKKIESLAGHFDLTCITSSSYTGYGLENRLADQPRPTSYHLVGLPAFGSPDSTTRYVLRGLGEALRRARPEIVLVESEPWAWLRWQTWWCARRLGRKVRFGEFSWENVRRSGAKGLLLSAAYRAAAATADFVIGGNEDAAQFFVEAGQAREQTLVAPQLGVDEEVFHPADAALKARRRAELGLPADAFLVGFSGRLLEMKGVPDLIAAVERVRAEPGGAAVQLALLGPGEIGPLLRPGSAQPVWMHVRPACAHAEMAHFMQALDLFVLPSREWNRDGLRWREQFGHVLIEAMACGIPVLGSSCGAIPSVLGDPARIFPEGDVGRLSEMLRAYVLAPGQRAAAVERQTRRLHENYTNAVLAARWAEFLQRMGRPARSAPAGGG